MVPYAVQFYKTVVSLAVRLGILVRNGVRKVKNYSQSAIHAQKYAKQKMVYLALFKLTLGEYPVAINSTANRIQLPCDKNQELAPKYWSLLLGNYSVQLYHTTWLTNLLRVWLAPVTIARKTDRSS